MPRTAKRSKTANAAQASTVQLALVEHNPSRQVHVDLSDLHQHTWANPREPVRPEQVAGLATTMQRFGMLQPIVVTPNPNQKQAGYVLLAGRRRVAAARSLGWRTVPAHVLARPAGVDDPLDHLLAAVALVENGQREDLDPLRECHVVESLLREPGATVETVAAELGRSRSWVARRARLVGLGAAARKEAGAGGLISRWPVAWLELLALLPEDEQVALCADQKVDCYTRIEDVETLRLVVRGRMKRLGGAPWDLADSTSFADAGACTGCGKHTGAQRDLFEEPRKVEIKEAACLDAACWTSKLATWRRAAVEAARAKHGNALVVVEAANGIDPLSTGTHYRVADAIAAIAEVVAGRASKAKPVKGAPAAYESNQVAKAKKGDRGAVPALVVSGAGTGTVGWVVVGHEDANGHMVPPKAPRPATRAPKSASDKHAQLLERRQRHVVLAFRDLLDQWRKVGPIPRALEHAQADDDLLLDIAGTWGCSVELLRGEKCVDDGDARMQTMALRGKRNERVLQGVMKTWAGVLRWGYQIHEAQPYHSEVEAMCKATNQIALLAELANDALRVCPEPKAWAKDSPSTGVDETKEARPTPRPKGKAPVASSAAHEVSCRVCGVSDSEVDTGDGVHWAEPALCSDCALAEQAAKRVSRAGPTPGAAPSKKSKPGKGGTKR
jgi:ParB/RepB/Spo0J family partition protein